MEENPAEPDGRSVHEDELAGNDHRAFLLQDLVDLERFAATVLSWSRAFGDGPLAIVEQRTIDETCPNVHRFDQLLREALEAPGLVGVNDELLVARQQTRVKVDDALDKWRAERPDTAVVQIRRAHV